MNSYDARQIHGVCELAADRLMLDVYRLTMEAGVFWRDTAEERAFGANEALLNIGVSGVERQRHLPRIFAK